MFLMSRQVPVSMFHIGLATPCSTVLQVCPVPDLVRVCEQKICRKRYSLRTIEHFGSVQKGKTLEESSSRAVCGAAGEPTPGCASGMRMPRAYEASVLKHRMLVLQNESGDFLNDLFIHFGIPGIGGRAFTLLTGHEQMRQPRIGNHPPVGLFSEGFLPN